MGPRTATTFRAVAWLWGLIAVVTTGTTTAAATGEQLTAGELLVLLEDVRGDDFRMVRYNANSKTRRFREENDGCAKLVSAVQDVLLESTEELVASRIQAAEYATFCITDHPENRAAVGQVPDLYSGLVSLISHSNPSLSAVVCHLIWILSFNHPPHQQGFFANQAVPALSDLILDTKAKPIQTMWAASALQNLAASYCDTRFGICDWYTELGSPTPRLEEDETVVSDGSPIRKAALEQSGLVQRLETLACTGPVKRTEPNDQIVFPGENARKGHHEHAPTLLAWAATGALKNLALEGSPSLELQDATMECVCRLSHSYDWLEEEKGQGLLRHVRPYDICLFSSREGGPPFGSLCVDSPFIDQEGNSCPEYRGVEEEQCKEGQHIEGSNLKAADACCVCGGGTEYPAVAFEDATMAGEL